MKALTANGAGAGVGFGGLCVDLLLFLVVYVGDRNRSEMLLFIVLCGVHDFGYV